MDQESNKTCHPLSIQCFNHTIDEFMILRLKAVELSTLRSAAMLEVAMKDLKPHADALQREKQNLKAVMEADDVPEEQLWMVVDNMTRVIQSYDDQVKLARRSLPKTVKAKSSKSKAKAKSAAAS